MTDAAKTVPSAASFAAPSAAPSAAPLTAGPAADPVTALPAPESRPLLPAPPELERTGDDLLPGDPDPRELVARMIRVNHAGEYGAKRIYEGQLAVLKRTRVGPTIRHMKEQEQAHLDAFEKLIVERRVRPTLLQPVWHVAGFALGAVTALIGERAAMACTVAVEEVIDEHYAAQSVRLGKDEAELKERIEQFRVEELEHRDIGLKHEAERAPGYALLSGAIKAGSRAAIWLAERF